MKKIILILLVITNLCYASNWECINRNGVIPTCNTWRWSVPHGWLVSVNNYHGTAVTFYADESNDWKF
jgi:hypothetical protein